jgi:hypothetical protein
MAVVQQVTSYLDPKYNQGAQQKGVRPDVEAAKFADGGIFSPNKGNQTTTAGSADPKDSRLAQANLQRGGASVPPPANTNGPSTQFGTSDDSGNDWRVKISINPNSKILYWDPNADPSIPGLVAPLKDTDGFIFPYVPQVSVSHSANYSSVPLTHSNYAQYFYESSAVASINITGDFTVQNEAEAKYFLAGIYFFRACTKMFYGFSGDYQGSPPPIVYLDGYGQHYLPHVPCVVTGFSHTMPGDVDYLEVNTPQSISTSKTTTNDSRYFYQMPGLNTGAGSEIITQTINTAYNRVPTASTFNVTLQPVISRTQAMNFDYSAFARGALIGGKDSLFAGGFL